MKIQERAVLHYRFDVKVVEAVSGKIKQTAVGFNVITNYYFNSRLTGSPLSKTADLFRYIAVGTGTGTPAVTDTALFSHLTRKAVTTLETVYEYQAIITSCPMLCCRILKETRLLSSKLTRMWCILRLPSMLPTLLPALAQTESIPNRKTILWSDGCSPAARMGPSAIHATRWSIHQI